MTTIADVVSESVLSRITSCSEHIQYVEPYPMSRHGRSKTGEVKR